MSAPGQGPGCSPMTVAASPVTAEQAHPSSSAYLLDNPQVRSDALAAEAINLQSDQLLPISRSASASSSLDPYYFGLQSPTDSPVPVLSPFPQTATTPNQPPINEPITPARNPANIDRRGLVGVGELATPRWTRSERTSYTDDNDLLPPFDSAAVESLLPDLPDDVHDDEPDSPWTIEAVDGEISDKEEIPLQPPPLKTLRSRPSIAEESGGEEILYPRTFNSSGASESARSGKVHRSSLFTRVIEDDTPRVPRSLNLDDFPASPPSSFAPARRAKKQTSNEFEVDHHGLLVSKRTETSPVVADKSKEDKTPSARKPRTTNINTSLSLSPRDGKARDRRRESLRLSISGTSKSMSKTTEHHSRQLSTGTMTSHLIDARRVQAVDFSHLPPSPASSSIQHLLKQSANLRPHTPPSSHKESLSQAASPNVAHSLLRGMQEGWSALDDEAALEALNKLDGLTGKTARARASVGSFGRASSSSRPVTPAKNSNQWEGIGTEHTKSKRGSGIGTGSEKEGKEPLYKHHSVSGFVELDRNFEGQTNIQLQSPPEKTPKKVTARMNFTPKRGSASSTHTSTPTTSSRDSASMSTGTSLTSMSSTPGRHSAGKLRRNSASSDISPSEANLLKDRVSSVAVVGDTSEGATVPPVPPLPKDLSSYRSPPPVSSNLSFPSFSGGEEQARRPSHDGNLERSGSLEVPVHSHQSSLRQGNQLTSGYTSTDSAPVAPKTPSKKWSFSNALNLRLSSSPSSGSKSGFPLSPRAVSFGQQLRKSSSKDKGSSKSLWSPKQPDAMTSAGSLASLSSAGAGQAPGAVATITSAKTPERGASRPGTGSSASTNHTTSILSAPPVDPLSPSASVRRTQSKRLTPSSIPFFRRSSSQSMQVPSALPSSASPPSHLAIPRSKNSASPPRDYVALSTSVPSSTSKKSSVLSLGLPSLLKSTSRRSLHSDAKDSTKENAKSDKDAEKAKAKAEKKKEERSESRISLMIRKRGKTLSSTDPRKPKSPVAMPPIQMSALEPATAQRVAKLKSSTSSTTSTTPAASRAPSISSRVTAHTASSMQKVSDVSLRSRTQLPTIAGSPSVGTHSHFSKENRELSSSSLNTVSGLLKETPTKIPRISSSASARQSPPLKNSASALASCRASGLASTFANHSPTGLPTSEFGVINDDSTTPKSIMHQSLMRSSPSASTSRLPRQPVGGTSNAGNGGTLPRKSNRDSMSFIGIRKPSTGSVASFSTPASNTEPPSTSHRFSALSPSKGLKLLGPKPSMRSSNSSVLQAPNPSRSSPSSSRQSLSTPSPVPSAVDEEEMLGDEEMRNYIKRQQAKRLAAGATQEELDEMLKFPEPIAPTSPLSPDTILRSNQTQHLSEYERKEIQEYTSVYFIGAKSKKKMATLDHSANNHGYDDERGDYLPVNHDHLAYRYEVIDTLGKGSFGQVLQCRDHCTGESVAIKIIRNKKRFHHQALVEIKILANLRKWDADEKHHVVKMNDHFYFRNHLCIAMELMNINLYELIKANGFVGFTTSLIRRFTTQMLMSLVLMRHHRIVHCDLKPENVLLKHPMKSAIKVIDFGSSCFEHEKIYTYIQSRFYRSPEVILGMNYHMAIDMWSLGCILAELYTGYPIFPGENEQEQLSCIMEVLGVPDKEFVSRSSRKKLFFDTTGMPRPVTNSKGRRRRPGSRTLAQALRCNDEEFVDFIAKCLVWDPERRMKPQTAMRHPFILAGRRRLANATSTRSTPSSSGLSSSRTKQVMDTPKKSLISAPTPLTARASRVTTNGVPATPSSTTHSSILGSASRSYRTPQNQSMSSSSRTLSGYVVSTQ